MINFALATAVADLPIGGSLDGVGQLLSFDVRLYRSGLRLLVAGLCEQYPALRRTARSGGRLVRSADL